MPEIKPKLLVLSPRFPYPVIGGDRLRIVELCRQFSSDFSITLLCLCDQREELIAENPMDSPFDSIERVYLPKWRSYINCGVAVFSSLPLQVAYYFSETFKRKLKRLQSEHDIVLAHLIRTGNYVRTLDRPKVLEMTDAISLNYCRVKKSNSSASFKTRIFSFEQSRLERYEKAIVKDFDRTVLISPIDKKFLNNGETNNSIFVCSNGVDIDVLPCQSRFSGKELVFIGCMTTVQNMDAALWFAENVMPLLVSDGFVFKVIGRIDSAFAERLKKFPGVTVTGTVDSISEAASKALIGVCPMRIGAGVQNKVLEYMALGLPTVSSKVGLEGLTDNSEALAAEGPEEWAEKIRMIATDELLWSRMSSKGRTYVEGHHSWVSMVKPYRAELVSLLGSQCVVRGSL